MAFTETEQRAWHADKRRREHSPQPVHWSAPAAVCLHCSNPFGHGEGVITEDAAICDVCL